jgi:hypothetical protein
VSNTLQQICAGDVGTTILFTVYENGLPLNISAATGTELLLQAPLKSDIPLKTVPASFYTDGTDGILAYTTVAGDIPATPAAVGTWSAQAYLVLGTWSGHTTPAPESKGITPEPAGLLNDIFEVLPVLD